MCVIEKAEFRATYRQVREDLDRAVVAAASSAVCQRLVGMSVVREAQTILGYVAFQNEVGLEACFETLPDKAWVVPRIEGTRLVVHAYDPERLVRHRFGMLEPPADAPVVDPRELDVVLVPGVAFDPQGGRLGFGGGFYDRFLRRTPAVRIGVCHDCCLVDAVPCAEHDEHMDWVVTPTRTLHTAPLREGGQA